MSCHYVSAESLRKYPPGGNIARIVTKAYECAEASMVMREGLMVLIPVYAIHHDPEFYENPEELRPERFSAEEVKKRPSGSFLSFGEGPRGCIAKRFGMMEAQIGLMMLPKHYKFSACDRTPPMPTLPSRWCCAEYSICIRKIKEKYDFNDFYPN